MILQIVLNLKESSLWLQIRAGNSEMRQRHQNDKKSCFLLALLNLCHDVVSSYLVVQFLNLNESWLQIRAGNSETRQALYLCQCRHEPHFRWLVTPVTQHYVNTFLANLDSKKYVLYHQLLNTFLANVDSK